MTARRFLAVPCGGTTLAATLDVGGGTSGAGLLIVSGGTEIRSGAHAGMARLAATVAAAGHSVLRFDRRGVGDSGGEDPGFADSAADIAAAAAALRAVLPAGTPVIGFGLCDAASALALHHQAAGIDRLLLANPWVVEPQSGLPPPAAVRHRYAARLADPAAWRRALTGGIDYRKAARGLASLVRRHDDGLATRIAHALGAGRRPASILLATGDATAIAFDAAWGARGFATLRRAGRIDVARIDTDSHSFAGTDDAAALARFVIAGLRDR